MDREALIHFIGGAMGGTAGTAVTCPLEVVKTRLQSSTYVIPRGCKGPSTSEPTKKVNFSQSVSQYLRRNFGRLDSSVFGQVKSPYGSFLPSSNLATHALHFSSQQTPVQRLNILRLFHRIIVDEGFCALYKGLGPNLIGVAPSKAVYFYSYSSCKRFLNDANVLVPNSAMIHMASAALAGFVAATAVNPIWLVKTRLQLHKGPLTVSECIKKVLRLEGMRGFYRGVTASYVGISETVIQFVLYEKLRSYIIETGNQTNEVIRKTDDFFKFMFAGGIAKFIACVAAYPHEVVRTRLREENSLAKGFFPTLSSIYHLEGFRALYRGLGVQLMRTVPNTAITMGTYEVVVYFMHRIF